MKRSDGELDELSGQVAVLAERHLPDVTRGHLALFRAEATRVWDAPPTQPWAQAVDLFDRIEHPYLGAYARWRLGEALLGRRRAAAASTPLREACRAAAGLGAKPLVEEIAALANRGRLDLDATPGSSSGPGRSSATGAAGSLAVVLTGRERQVLGLLAQGRTNREVARELFVTEKTAAAHVSNILHKLGVRSRVEAAGMALRSGLVQQ